MHDFHYASPESVDEVVSMLADHGDDAAILSGGQSLMPMLRLRAATPEYVVDINSLPDAEYIDVADGEIAIGCLVRHADVAHSDAVQEACPVLAATADRIGDRQVRNRGTICGSVAHADPAGDPPVLATLLDADIVAQTTDGTETYDGADFYHGFYETDISKTTLVTEVRFPTMAETEGGGYAKYEPSEGAYPVATVGAHLELDDGVVADARIVTGAVEPGPTPMPEAADSLVDGEPTEDAITEAAQLAGDNADPIGDAEGSAEFKSEITKTLTKRALRTALERAGAPLQAPAGGD